MGKRLYSLAGAGSITVLLLLVCLLIAAGAVQAQEADTGQAIDAAAAWLVTTHQNDDGGYTAFSTGANAAPSDVAGTVDALLALGAVGRPVDEPLAFLESQPAALAEMAAQSGGSAGKLALALAAAGADPADFAGFDAASTLAEQFADDGSANVTDPYNQALAILGLVAAGEPVPQPAIDFLLALQATGGELSGSWDDGFGTAGNTDATAMAVMALSAAGLDNDSQELQAAGDFLEQSALETGGWGYAPGLPESANSTALGLQALSALGRDFDDALAALLAWQQPSGAFAADFGDGPFDDTFTTLQALPALTTAPYPLAGAGADPAEEEGGEPVEGTSPVVAWILLALALIGAAAVWYWGRSGRGL